MGFYYKKDKKAHSNNGKVVIFLKHTDHGKSCSKVPAPFAKFAITEVSHV
jgi:hypothetical protein